MAKLRINEIIHKKFILMQITIGQDLQTFNNDLVRNNALQIIVNTAVFVYLLSPRTTNLQDVSANQDTPDKHVHKELQVVPRIHVESHQILISLDSNVLMTHRVAQVIHATAKLRHQDTQEDIAKKR